MKGFTLIELLIVVAIVGILAAVAIPAYSVYATQAKLTEGVAALKSAGTEMEINYSLTNTYNCVKGSWDSQYFHYECTATTDAYTLTAAGLGDIAGYSYSLNSKGERKTLSHPAGTLSNCWRISKTC